jgi:hypothetical protein
MKAYGCQSERNNAMKAQFLILAGLVFLVSSVTRAQGISVVSFSAATFGYDQARLALAPPGRLLFTWSEESNLSQMSVRSLALNVSNSQKDRQIVDRTIAWMFKHFPQHVNEWRPTERFADLR